MTPMADRIQKPVGRDGSGIEPISVRIPAAVAMTGLSRSRIYELIATGELQIAKDRRSTLILVASLRDVVTRRMIRVGDSAPS